jgi:flagellin
MPYAVGGNARIRTNISAENAYNALDIANKSISQRQLELSTGKRINNAGDDVAGYITSKALHSRNGTLQAALRAVGDANNISQILMDALDNINTLVNNIKDSTSTASSGSQGTDERVALAKAAFRMAQQVQTVVDTTVFGGQQLLSGAFYSDFVIGSNASHNLVTLSIDLSTSNIDFDIASRNFDVNSLSTTSFAGVSNLDLNLLNDVNSGNLGIFSASQFTSTLMSLDNALNNITKVTSYIGGIVDRLNSQEDLLNGQIVNYNAAISRIEDSDTAQEQLDLIKAQFLQQASLVSLAQANQNPQSFLQLIKGQ